MPNPLEQYFRHPKLYIKLPSQGVFYAPDMLDTTVNEEIPVYPMTALDQITIRTPDALLNGDALLKIVSNCVPAIKDPKKLVEPDINTVLLAIRVASTGPTLSMDLACPKCNHDNSYQVDLNAILETQQFLDVNNTIDLDGDLIIHLRPYDFEQRNLTLLNEIQQTQAVSILDKDADMGETAKLSELGRLVTKMATRTFDIMAKSITHISIVKTGQTVTDTDFISEFVRNINKSQADVIMSKLKELNTMGIDSTCHFKCESCNHEWDHTMDFDPASFFG